MKKNVLGVLIFFLFSILVIACSENKNDSKNTKNIRIDKVSKQSEEEKRYNKYINIVDAKLKEYKDGQYSEIRYGEFSGYPYFSNLTQNSGESDKRSDYYPVGDVSSYFIEDNLLGFQMNIGWNTSGSYQKGGDYKYQCEKFSIEENLIYYSYSTDCEDKKEIPSFMCIDGISKIQYRKKKTDDFEKYSLEKEDCDREYLSNFGVLYEINRKERTISEVEDNIAKLYINWCESQEIDMLLAEKKFQVNSNEIAKLVPKGYKFSKKDYHYSVADINMDGMDDILVILCPIKKQYVYNGYYSKASPYGHINEYGYYQLWVFKGMEDGKYKPQKLMNSIVWEEAYTLCGIQAFDGGFTMRYFVGRAPFETILRKFQYSKEKQDWFLSASYNNSSYINSIQQGFTISGTAQYGKEYLSYSNDDICYEVSVGKYINHYKKDFSSLDYEGDGYLIRFHKKETADKVTKTLERELDKILIAMKNLEDCYNISIYEDEDVFLNKNVFVIFFNVSYDIDEDNSISKIIPLCIDLRTGSLINFKEHLSDDEFAKLCEKSNINISNLKEWYEHCNNYEYLLKSASPAIALCLMEEGLVMIDTSEYLSENYTITREKLINTELSNYWNDWP